MSTCKPEPYKVKYLAKCDSIRYILGWGVPIQIALFGQCNAILTQSVDTVHNTR